MGWSAWQCLVGLRSWESLTGSEFGQLGGVPSIRPAKEGAIAVVWRMSAIGPRPTCTRLGRMICGTGCEEYRSLAAALEQPPGTGLVY
jgi:hypothetical protein